MSGRVDKTYSMEESQRGQGDREDQRSLGNGKHARSQSPLKFFAEAKKSINDVFKDIAEYVKESHAFLNGMSYIKLLLTHCPSMVMYSSHILQFADTSFKNV